MKLFILVFLFFSCTHKPDNYDISSVSLSAGTSDSIEIDNDGGEADLAKQGANDTVKPTEKQPKINLTLYSTIYHSLAFLELVKSFEKNEIEVNIISSQGFGTILAALYAKEKSASYLEWKLFDLLKRLKGKIAYSKKWRKEILKYVEKEFKELKVQDLKLVLVIPYLEGKNVKASKEAKIVDLIDLSLDLNSRKNYFNSPTPYGDLIKVMGADLSFEIAFLPKSIKFNSLNGFEWGIYTSFLGKVMKDDYGVQVLRSTNTAGLDELKPITDISKNYKGLIDGFTLEVQEAINSWREESTTGLLNY